MSLYGALIGLGIVIAAYVAAKLLESRGEDGNVVWDGLWWMLIPGVIGARAYHVIDQWSYYSENWKLISQVWLGGMGIFGGILGGVLGLFVFSVLYSRKQERKAEEVFFALADVVVMGAVLAQALGRWGNYFNGELYGSKTNLPWGVEVVGKQGLYHPLFLYESLLNIALFLLLMVVYKRNGVRGSTFGGYLIGYGSIRIFLESLRYEYWTIDGFSVARVVGVIFVIVGWVVMRRKKVHLRDEDIKILKD